MKYAKAIRIARAATGMSQKDLAKRAKIDPSYVSLLEGGARVPGPRAIQRIAKALNVPMPVMTLLAAEKPELRGLNQDQAAVLGRYILEMLSNADSA